MASRAKTEAQATVRTKLAYGTGHGLVSAKNMLFHFFFLFYFSNVLGVSEGLVFLVTAIALFFDAFSDPIMGQISDNFRSKRWGRRHGFMFWAIIPTALCLALLFAPPEGLGVNGLFVWMLLFTLAVRLGLTVYGVPYYTLGAELSTNYNERTSIFGYREFFNTFFNIMLFASAFIIFLKPVDGLEDGMLNKAGYVPLVIFWAVVGGITSLVSIYGTRKQMPPASRYANDPQTRWTDTFSQLGAALRVEPFVWLCAGYSLIVILYGALSALGLYHLTYQWQFSQEAKFIVAVSPLLTILPCVLLASFLTRRVDKKAAAIIFAIIYAICIIIPNGAYLMQVLPALGSDELLLILTAFNSVGFMGLTGVVIVANSMMADVADAMELETTKRQEGVLFAAFSFAQKMTFVCGTAVASLSIFLIGFPKQAQPSDVPQAAINGLALAPIIISIMLSLAGIYCFKRYALGREALKDIQVKLIETRS